MNTGLISRIHETRPSKGRVLVWWLGQMGYVFKKGNTTLMVDGFLTERPDRLIPPAFTAAEAVIFDAVMGSHNHDDHIDKTAWKTIHGANPETVFIASGAHRQDILDSTGIEIQPAVCGKTLTIGDFTIDVIPAAHEFIERDADGSSLHLSFIIDGRIFHAGDTLTYDGQRALIRSFGKMSAMLLPINGRDAERYTRGCIGNMTFQEAVDLAGDLAPDVAIPGHWDMFRGNTEDPEKFRAYLKAKYPQVNCLIPERFKAFEI